MEKRKIGSKKITNIRGIFILEMFVIMLFFILLMALVNNGIVNVTRQEWLSASDSAALAGAVVLHEKAGEATAGLDAIDEAIRMALLHSWMGGAITNAQVVVTLGNWADCAFTAGNVSPNAVRVEISPPLDESGNPTGFMTLFGSIDMPMFQTLTFPVSSVGVVYEDAAVLVEYQGNVCIN